MASEKRLYRSVLEKLQGLIDTGEYRPGGRLPPERELAQRFNVSRPTVREAIIALEALGRVEVKVGSGVYVLKTPAVHGRIDMSITAFELTEARALIEGEAAALAATMISDSQLEQLAQALNEMADESADGNLAAEAADQRFHRIISEATRNAMLIAVVDELWFVRDNSPVVHRAYQSICEADVASRLAEHRDILEALRRRDPVAARTAMHGHFSRILNKLIAVDEAEQVEAARERASKSRERYSLGHLA